MTQNSSEQILSTEDQVEASLALEEQELVAGVASAIGVETHTPRPDDTAPVALPRHPRVETLDERNRLIGVENSRKAAAAVRGMRGQQVAEQARNAATMAAIREKNYSEAWEKQQAARRAAQTAATAAWLADHQPELARMLRAFLASESPGPAAA